MGLQLNPEFQRGHVWTEEQQIAWVEYYLRGGKSGNTIYLNNHSGIASGNLKMENIKIMCVLMDYKELL